MNRPRVSAANRGRLVFAVSLLALFLLPDSASAQNSALADRLPADTWMCVSWPGMKSLSAAQKTNHLLALWADPDFAPARRALFAQMYAGSTKGAASQVSPDQFASFLALLDNSLVFGFAGTPNFQKTGVAAPSANGKAGVFLIYDATGKEDLVKALVLLQQATTQEKPSIEKYTFAGAPVEKRTTSKGDSYTAWSGSYFIAADEKQTIEKLITNLGSSAAPAESLAKTPEYAAIQHEIGPDAALQVFARFPDLTKLAVSKPGDHKFAEFVRNLHLEKIHAMGFGAAFDGEATRMRGGILGDTSAGSPLDITGPSGPMFATMPLAAHAAGYSVSRLNFAALYKLVMQAISDALPPEQAAMVTTIQASAEKFLGVPVETALQLFTGEFASTSSFADDGSHLQVHAVTIRNPELVLRVLRAVVGSQIANEDQNGSTTYLDLAAPYLDPATRRTRRKFYYIAVSPQLLVLAPRKAMAREAIAEMAAADPDGKITPTKLPADAETMRALLPANLSGFGYLDMTQVPWDKVISSTMQAANTAGVPSKLDWLKEVNPSVLSRYLHCTVSGWWKDSSGIHFDSYVQ
jgi:hypothetical protein